MNLPATRPMHVLGAGAVSGTAIVMLIPDAWLGDALVPPAVPWGINLAAAVGIVIAAAVWLAGRHAIAVQRQTIWIALAALAVAAGTAWRASDELRLLDLAALGGLAVLATFSLRGVPAHGRMLVEYGRAAVRTAVSGATAVLRLAFVDIEWNATASPPTMRGASGVAWGIVLAVPFVLVFGALFASADTVFATMVWNSLRVDLSMAAARGFHALFFGAVIAGFLREAFVAERSDILPQQHPGSRLGVPVLTALVAITLLFLAFVAIQLRYLYGGDAQVQSMAGLTYAEYARRGFFELVSASVLVLPTLMAAEWAVRGADDSVRSATRWISRSLLVLLGVVMASAVKRLDLYVDAYGLTTDRFYAATALGYLAMVFGWFALTALRGEPARFVFGAAVAALAVLGVLHAANPDALVLRYNLARDDGRGIDVVYAATVSPDAATELQMVFDRLGGAASPDACAVARRLVRWRDPGGDWRAWSAGRARAARIASATPLDQTLAACDAATPPAEPAS